MHEVMKTSSPKINYMSKSTYKCIKEIKAIREGGTDLFFTVDAGPQVKIVCKPEDKDLVKTNFSNKPYVKKIVQANIGLGARVIHES